MKRVFQLGLFIFSNLLLTNNLLGQIDLVSSFNSTISGHNLSVTVSKIYPNLFEFGGGLRININSLKLTNKKTTESVHNKLYTQEPFNYFGIEGFINRSVFNNMKFIDLFIFYDLQITYAPTREIIDITFINDDGSQTVINDYEYIKGPYLWVENFFGIGFKISLKSRFFIQQKSGLGITFLSINSKDSFIYGGNSKTWTYSYLLSVGLGYRFGGSKNLN